MNRQVLAGREMELGPEHPDALMTVCSLEECSKARASTWRPRR
jgi:hypothetical protein